MKLRSLLLVVLLISGCASVPPIQNYNGPDKGYVALGITVENGTEYGAYRFLFRNPEGAMGQFIYLQNNMWSPSVRDFDSSTINGLVDVVSLPPGTYSLYTHRVAAGGGNTTWYPLEEFDHQFTVEPNKVTYLGSVLAKGTTGTLLGAQIPTGAAFFVEDQRERDREIISKKIASNEVELIYQVIPSNLW